jgi:hypothetical protein
MLQARSDYSLAGAVGSGNDPGVSISFSVIFPFLCYEGIFGLLSGSVNNPKSRRR